MTRNPIDTTRHLLRQIPHLHAELPSTRYMARLRDDTNIRTSVAGSRPPLDMTLLDLKDGREIYNWVRTVYETMMEHHCPQPGPDGWNEKFRIEAGCDWLANYTEWIIEHFPAPEPIAQDLDQCALRCPDGHYLTANRIRRIDGRYVCSMCPEGFAESIKSLHWMYRRAAGHHDDVKLKCLTCGNRAFIDGIWFICSEVEEHARTLEDIEHENRYRPAEPTAAICQRFTINEDRIHQWRQRHKLAPADRQGRTLLWWPWDVFCLINPTVAEAINARDQAQETA